jgi:2-aminobenzoate-CoA ligase
MKFSGDGTELAPSAHTDTFARDNLPPREHWPVLHFDLPELRYPVRLNAASVLMDQALRTGRGEHTAVLTDTGTLTYRALAERVNRLSHALVRDLKLQPGNRVLLRGYNEAWMVAAYLAVWRAGGVVVGTMPLLRAHELGQILRKAEISHALCDVRLADPLLEAKAPKLHYVATWGDGAIEELCAKADPDHPACDTAADDVALIAFTSGTTGEPKGCMHFHRDILAICDSYARHVLRADPSDRFIGSPPLAFTFGLGGLVLFPFRIGATAILPERASPEDLLAAIGRHRATVCFSAPTAYRVMASHARDGAAASLRRCVSAGEALPPPVLEAWHQATGLKLMDGIGATELLHIFVGTGVDEARPGLTGRAVPGYRATVLDDAGKPAPEGAQGRFAVQGPTGCRYLADDRQRQYVQHGWNITGDTYIAEPDGWFRYQARSDDMIISAGYNIAGPEVEAALLTHAMVRECGVVGAPDAARGKIVQAYVVLKDPAAMTEATAKALQEHVKQAIAPYKYPRAIVFVEALPKTASGKLQRHTLRAMAEQEARNEGRA